MYLSLSTTPPEAGAAPSGGSRRMRGTVSSTVVAFGVVSMLTDISSEAVTAVLPLYVTAYLGLSPIAFGLLDGLHQGVSAVVRIAGGYTSDRLDRPKWVAFAGYAVAAVSRIGLVFASGFAALATVVTADRIGKGIRTAPRDAVITASSPREGLGLAFGVHRTLDAIGAVLGPLLAFVILLLIPNGYGTVFVASLAFALIGVVVLGLFVPDVRTRSAEPTGGTTPKKSQRPPFEWNVVLSGPMRRVLAAAGILGLLSIGDGFVYLVLQSQSDFGARWFPLLYVGTNIAFLALAIPCGRLADRVGRARVFVYGHLALVATYLVAVLPVGNLGVPLCLLLLGVFYAATDGVLAALAAQLTTPTTRGTGIAAAQTVVALSRFGAATGFGVLWYLLGSEVAMLVVSAGLVVAVPLVAWLLWPLMTAPRPSSDETSGTDTEQEATR